MSFFNTKDLSDITTNMMADCSSMESMLSSTIPPLIANIISVTLTCICLAFLTGEWPLRFLYDAGHISYHLVQTQAATPSV